MDTVTTFTAGTLGALTEQHAGLASIPIEFFYSFPPDILHANAGGGSVLPVYNNNTLLAGGYTGTQITCSMAGFTVDPASPYRIVHTSTSEDVGAISVRGATSLFQTFDSALTGASAPSVYAALTGNIELVAANVSDANGSWLYDITAFKPGKTYAGFRPMTDEAYAGITFVDNLAFNGYGAHTLYTVFDPLVGTPLAADNNQFVGYIKRSAMGLAAGDLTEDDVVLGVLSQGASGKIIANGVVLATQTHSVATSARELWLEYIPTSDTSAGDESAYNAVSLDIYDTYLVGLDAVGVADSFSPYAGTVVVDMAEAVLASINDADLTGIGSIGYTGSADGYYASRVTCDAYYGHERLHGAFFVSGSTFGDAVRPLDVIVTRFGDAVRALDVTVSYPYGNATRPLDVTLRSIYAYAPDHVIRPLRVRVTRFGDAARALDVTISRPHGDAVRPLDVRLTQSGDAARALNVSVRDATARTSRSHWRVLLGGVDVTVRLTGVIKTHAEEGGARLAWFTLAPSHGSIDPYSWVGSPVVIDFLTLQGEVWVARRGFTGKVHLPEYRLADGTVAFTCTDDRQNRLAAMPIATIDAITGGRYDVAVQGEQTNSYEYAEARMQSVAGSLDADAYGAFRVTPWDSAEVWATYTTANTQDGSIDFVAPQRTNIVNKIVTTFEYRFTRLHRRTASISFKVDVHQVIENALPLLARTTVESALEATGWEFYYGGDGAFSGGGGGGFGGFATAGASEKKRLINWVPFPATVELPLYGVYSALWINQTGDTTVMEFSCPMYKRWAQTVTETYTLTVSAPESIAANGEIVSQERASLASEWDSGPWEADPLQLPVLDGPARIQTLDHAPDATPEQRDAAIQTQVDVCTVKIKGSHRSGRGKATTWLTPELDLDKRIRIEHPTKGVGEGKVVLVEHTCDLKTGNALTSFEIAISGHGAIGLPEVTPTPSTPPDAPAVPTVDDSVVTSFGMGLSLHIGGLSTSPEFDENWEGWIVNVPASFNVTDPGSTAPRINPETQKTEREQVNAPYSGTTTNPLYRADKAYATTGFRVVLPAVEDESRDAAAPAVAASYDVPIPADTFTLNA